MSLSFTSQAEVRATNASWLASTATTEQWTVSAWVYFDSFGDSSGYHVIASLANNTNGQLGCQVHNVSGSWRWSIGDQSADYDYSSGPSTGQWYHVAFVRDGSTSAKLYVDGTLILSPTIPAGNGGDELVLFGYNNYGGTQNLDGHLAAVKTWNRALSANEINAERWQQSPVAGDYRSFYPFLVKETTDWSKNGLTLTLTEIGGSFVTGPAPPVPWCKSRARRVPYDLGARVGAVSKGCVGTGASSVQTTAVDTATSGSTFVVFVITDSALTISTPTDNKSNTYSAIGAELTVNGNWGRHVRGYKCENGAGGSGHQVTAGITGGTDGISAFFVELRGVATTSVQDGTNQAADGSTPFTSGTFATANASDIILGFISGDNGSDNPITYGISGATPTDSWQIVVSEVNGTSYWPGAVAAVRVGATGTYGAGFTESGSVSTCGVIAVAFKAAGSVTYQYAYPTTDTTRDNWEEDDGTTTNIYDQIDETSADDADYIRTQLAPTSDVYVTKFTSLTDPNSSTGYRASLRYGKDASGGDTLSLLGQIRQGYSNESSQGTLIATVLNNSNIDSGWNQVDYDFSGAEADSVTNHGDLYLRLVANTESTLGIVYVGSQKGGFAGKTGTTTVTFSLTGGTDSTPQAGDFVIVSYCVGSTADRALTIRNASSTDYTLIGSELYQNDTYDVNLRCAYRFMPSPTPETTMVLSGTGSTNDAGSYTIHVFRNVDTGTPLDVTAVTAGGTDTRLANPGAITPTTSGSIIYVVGAAACATAGAYTASYLSGFQAQNNADTNDSMIGAGYVTWTSGQYDPAAFTGGGTDTANDSWAAVTVALRKATTTRRAQVSWARFRTPEATSPTYNDSISFATTLAQSQAPVATALPARSEAITLAHAQAPIASGQPTVSFSVTLTQSQAGGVNYAESITFSTTLTQTPAANASALAVLTLPLGLASTHEALAAALPSLTFPVTLSQDQAAAVLAGATLNVSITLGYTAEGVQVSLFVESITFGATLTHEIAALVSGQTALAFPVAVTFSPVPTATALRSVTFSATLTHAQTFQRTADNSITYHTTMGHVIAPLVTARPTLTLPATLGFTPLQGQNLIESITFTAHMGMGVSYPWMPEVGQEVTWTKEAGNGGTWTKETQGTVSWSRAGAVGSIWTKEDSIDKEWH